jgi:hypothetical protein
MNEMRSPAHVQLVPESFTELRAFLTTSFLQWFRPLPYVCASSLDGELQLRLPLVVARRPAPCNPRSAPAGAGAPRMQHHISLASIGPR